jgi:hypothetical protein
MFRFDDDTPEQQVETLCHEATKAAHSLVKQPGYGLFYVKQHITGFVPKLVAPMSDHLKMARRVQTAGSASALVTFFCVLCTLRSQISQSMCKSVFTGGERRKRGAHRITSRQR